jgi:aminoglycoside phosphotransferase family enzyme/predicted kinase
VDGSPIGAPPLPGVLHDPATYPGAPSPCVVETHVSWIALAGPYAYKLKKPVRYAFLDYSTPERRLAACRTELALNRRWARDLYLDLRWLARTPAGGARFYGESDVESGRAPPGAEPVVRMRRFDREQELDRLVMRRDVAPDELRTLGAALAGWQSAAPAAPADAGWGDPTPVLDTALECIRALRAPPSPFAAGRLDALEQRLRDRHRALAPWFVARRAGGRVRECHGDLHCRNVVRLDGRLIPFDAIDFAPGLRWIDVASDAAFLAMDLLQFGRADLACAFLDGWLEAGGDHEAANGLPWYVACRALVRAEVDALRARQLADGAERDAAWSESARFLSVAETWLEPIPGRLYATTGPSGSGKSRLAERLATTLPAIRLRSDVERKRLAGRAPLDGGGEAAGLYATAMTEATYGSLASAARGLLTAGFDVIVDAASLRRGQRDLLRATASEAGTSLAWLECIAPVPTLRARVAQRRGDASEATVAVLERQLATSEPLGPDEAVAAVRVRTDEPVDAAAVARSLRAAAAPPGGSTPASAPAS